MYKFDLSIEKNGFVDITANIRKVVEESGIMTGVCVVYCPHTTAAITINENCDKNVTEDLNLAMDRFFPRLKEYKHDEGNSDGHLKSSIIGASEFFIINRGKLVLGQWQSVYFAEFDAPRKRHYFVQIIGIDTVE